MIRIPEDTKSGDNNPWRKVTVKVKNSLSSKQMKQVIDELDRAVMKMKKGEVALSGEASASFELGRNKSYCGALGSFRGFSWRHLLRKLVLR
ncbi:unnamed protein product [Brassica napus]|uniref:(rape) hypothetical protein n=1 Tax=Brassica napus TaxID=3708 RepID=A0A816J694_BRANA|nr:unnamed protein product [Brassica napus]